MANNANWNRYKDVSWNSNDLFNCKNAVRMLLIAGCSVEELQELDFGNLDVWSVIEECIE